MKTAPLTMAAALILWGYQTGLLVPACVMAAVIEFARITKVRWNPTPDQVNKLSDTCTVGLAGAIVYFVSLDLDTALKNTLCSLPFFIFALVVVQEYSTAGNIDVRSLYLFKKNITGQDKGIRVNLSLAFIIICLISTGAQNNRLFPYYPAVLAVIVFALFSQRTKGADIWVWAAGVTAAAMMGFFMQESFHHAQKVMTQRAFDRIRDDSAGPLRGTTAIGRVGRLKQSNRIVFRVIPPDHDKKGTYYLKEAAYIFLSGSMWSAAHNRFEPVPQAKEGTFITGRQRFFPSQVPGDKQAEQPSGSTLTILTRIKKQRGVLKVPADVLEISCSAIDSVKTNGLGTFMVEDAPGFITYDVRYGDPATKGDPGTKIAPPGKLDLIIPDSEKALFLDLASELGLGPERPVREVLVEIKNYFLSNFSYTLDLKADDKKSPVTAFMTQTRAGHCEYFATATVLLLRAAGIPARYVSGYLAFEKSLLGNKIIVRKKHAHAWTEVFVNGRWIFFDTTPPSWIDEESSLVIRTAIPDLFSLLEYGMALLRWGNPQTKKKLLVAPGAPGYPDHKAPAQKR